jgi:Domain of unknown function (DUF4389)
MTDIPVGAGFDPDLTSGPAGPPDQILVAFAEPAHQNRLTVLVRIILAIPHLIVLWALGIATEIVVIICWFAALFLGRLPVGLAGFITGYLNWLTRVQAYLFLLTDRYPPFELGPADYPVQLELRPGALNRLAVFFRLILAIPAHIVTMLVVLGMETIVMFITWLIVLVAGRMPRALHEAIAAGLRYYIRFTGYLFLVTATYPWGLFGDDAPEPAPGTGWLGGEQPWRLVLSGGAKVLVGMFLAIGVLVAGGYGALTAVTTSSSNTSSNAATTVSAGQAMDTAWVPLSSTVSSYQSNLAACGNNLGCAHGVDTGMSRAFAAFSADLQGISMPNMATSTAAAAVQGDANQLASDFTWLSTASSPSQYHEVVASSGLNARLYRFAAEVRSLDRMLGVV